MAYYKCLECGNIFEEGEERTWREDYGEELSGCPCCGGAYDEAYYCKECDSQFVEDELYEGYCFNCLADSITYDKGLEFIKESDLLIDFMVGKFYECDVPADFTASEKFLNAIEENFLRMKADDLICDRFDFLDCIKEFILKDDGECGVYNYAEWLSERK